MLILGVMNQKNKYLKLLLILSIIIFFLGVYQMLLFDGKAKGCSGDNFFEFRELKSTNEILELINQECSKYRNYFDYWKYITFFSVVLFFGSSIYLNRRK
jgi:hypothetical protein